MKDRYLIIADDFTGANDTGVQLRRRGLSTNVYFSNVKSMMNPNSSIVIDTETRNTDPDTAYSIVKQSVSNIDFAKYRYVIKKVDSTIRGNIAAEVKAVDEEYKPELIIFAPALPDLDRTTESGVQKLKGINICNTELAKDPKSPVKEDNLERILKKVYEEYVIHVSLDELRNGSFNMDGARLFTFDAVTNVDLERIIEAANATGKKILWIGSAGIADRIVETEVKTLPVLGVVASVSSTTNQQIKYCENAGYKLIQIQVQDVLLKEVNTSQYVQEVIKSLHKGQDTILLANTSYDREELYKSVEAGAKIGMNISQVGDYIRKLLGEMTKEIISQAKISGIFVTGGDTALGLLTCMEAEGSKILSEILVGVPLIKVVGGYMDGIKVVTKAGAFGKEDTIAFAMRKIKEKN